MVVLMVGTKTDEDELFSIGLNKESEQGKLQLWTGRNRIQKVWYNKRTHRIEKTTGGNIGYCIGGNFRETMW